MDWTTFFAGLAAQLLVTGVATTWLTMRVQEGFHRAAEEHRVRFSALHAKRAEVLGDLYRMIVQAHHAFLSADDATVNHVTRVQRAVAWYQNTIAIMESLDRNRLWLPRETASKVGELLVAFDEAGGAVQAAVRQGTADVKSFDGMRVVVERFQPLTDELEQHFRDLVEPTSDRPKEGARRRASSTAPGSSGFGPAPKPPVRPFDGPP